MIWKEMPITPRPTDGQWNFRKCYFRIGEVLTFHTGGWLGFSRGKYTVRVVDYEVNQYGRVSYVVKFRIPAMRTVHHQRGDRQITVDKKITHIAAHLEDLI